MAGRPRREIEEQVDVLREHSDGKDFAAAVERYAADLDEADRATLRDVILNRMTEQASRHPALGARFERAGYFHRKWKRLTEPPPG